MPKPGIIARLLTLRRETKPPLGLRVAGAIIGAALIALGLMIVLYFLTHRGYLISNDYIYPQIYWPDKLGTVGGIMVSFFGYMVAHKSLIGVWL